MPGAVGGLGSLFASRFPIQESISEGAPVQQVIFESRGQKQPVDRPREFTPTVLQRALKAFCSLPVLLIWFLLYRWCPDPP